MVRAIIFDCFGVLATEGWLPFKARYFKGNPAALEAAGDLMKQANSGLISYDDFLDKVAALAGISKGEVLKAIRGNVPNERLFEYIKNELKPSYKIGFLSNVADDYMRQIFTSEQLGLLDSITLSYKTGFIKPDTEAYTTAAAQLEEQSEDCLLVDDKESNVGGAVRAGMQGILYKDFEQFKSEIEKVLADPKA